MGQHVSGGAASYGECAMFVIAPWLAFLAHSAARYSRLLAHCYQTHRTQREPACRLYSSLFWNGPECNRSSLEWVRLQGKILYSHSASPHPGV